MECEDRDRGYPDRWRSVLPPPQQPCTQGYLNSRARASLTGWSLRQELTISIASNGHSQSQLKVADTLIPFSITRRHIRVLRRNKVRSRTAEYLVELSSETV